MSEAMERVNNHRSPTEYRPTLAEEKLLRVLMNPQHRMKSITDVCRMADINRSTYYDSFAKPDFNEYYKQRSLELVRQQVAPVINAFVAEAKRGSFQHGKVLLEMAGIYAERQQIEAVNVNVELTQLSTEERLQRIEELQTKLLGKTPEVLGE